MKKFRLCLLLMIFTLSKLISQENYLCIQGKEIDLKKMCNSLILNEEKTYFSFKATKNQQNLVFNQLNISQRSITSVQVYEGNCENLIPINTFNWNDSSSNKFYVSAEFLTIDFTYFIEINTIQNNSTCLDCASYLDAEICNNEVKGKEGEEEVLGSCFLLQNGTFAGFQPIGPGQLSNVGNWFDPTPLGTADFFQGGGLGGFGQPANIAGNQAPQNGTG